MGSNVWNRNFSGLHWVIPLKISIYQFARRLSCSIFAMIQVGSFRSILLDLVSWIHSLPPMVPDDSTHCVQLSLLLGTESFGPKLSPMILPLNLFYFNLNLRSSMFVDCKAVLVDQPWIALFPPFFRRKPFMSADCKHTMLCGHFWNSLQLWPGWTLYNALGKSLLLPDSLVLVFTKLFTKLGLVYDALVGDSPMEFTDKKHRRCN